MDSVPILALSQVIQLAVAPVFLLTGIAGFLSVLSNRLNRVVDRTRFLTQRIRKIELDKHREQLNNEVILLKKRTQIIIWAIRLAVSGALVICLVVMCLFIGDYALLELTTLITFLFVTAMMLVIFSLLLLLLEVSSSTKYLRNSIEHLFE